MDHPALPGDEEQDDESWVTPGTLFVFNYYCSQVWSLMEGYTETSWEPVSVTLWDSVGSHRPFYGIRQVKHSKTYPMTWTFPEEWTE